MTDKKPAAKKKAAPKVKKAKAGEGRKLISEARNVHKPMSFVVEFECEEVRQFNLTPEALELLQDNGFVPDVCETMALIRPDWKEANKPKSSGSVFGLGGF
ncbi:MAG: hypothetical protein ACYSW8_33170 [Planctomycetota bacterium]|jgi:hypothetical protein